MDRRPVTQKIGHSHGLEFVCWNGDVIRLAFLIDAHDREIISWRAVGNARISRSDVRDMLLEAVESRFGTHRAPEQVEVLSDNGSAYTAKETRIFAQQLGLKSCFTPVKSPQSNGMSEAFVKTLERDLHVLVAFVVLPIFAFANAGIALSGLTLEDLTHPIPMGIALGLIVGKPIGIAGFCWVALKLKWVQLPESMNKSMLLGTSFLCGIGFTMSLFIGSLAFEETGANLLIDERLGILIGSVVSGILGYVLIRWSLQKMTAQAPKAS